MSTIQVGVTRSRHCCTRKANAFASTPYLPLHSTWSTSSNLPWRFIQTVDMLTNSRDQSTGWMVQRRFYGSTRASGEAEARDAIRATSSSFSMMAVYGIVRPPCRPGSSRSAHGSGWYASGALYRLSKKDYQGMTRQLRWHRMEMNSIREQGRRFRGHGSCVIPPVLRFSD